MKICLISNLYKPYARGGAETAVELIADGLKKGGYEVVIITTKPLFNKVRIQKSEIRIHYVNGIYYHLNKIPKFLRLFWHLFDMFGIGGYLAVSKILKKEKPDAVMTHCLKGIGYLIPRAVKSLKIRHIHTLHDIQLIHPSGLMYYGREKIINGMFSKLYQLLSKLLFGSPDVVVSPSKWLMEIHTSRGFFKKSKKIILPNPSGVSAVKIKKAKREAEIFRFLYVGQIEEHKGILFLIRAFKNINKDLADNDSRASIKLIAAGNGSQLNKALEIAGKNDNIELLGRKSKEEVAELMLAADCLIVPSLCYDNSPMVLYEAFTLSLPAIASRIGGIPELVEGKSLFEPGNEEDLADKMKRALKRDKKKRAAVGCGINRLGAGDYVKKLMELI